MAVGDGNGWVACRCGARHWGRHGAAGLLLTRRDAAARLQVLLQLRADWTHEGGTWGLPGGAADSHEDAVRAALREAHEEADVDPHLVEVVSTQVGVDHGDWSYTYVLGRAGPDLQARAVTRESDDVRWVALVDVTALPLHSGLVAAWPVLHEQVQQSW